MERTKEIEKTYDLLSTTYKELRKNKETGGWFYNEYLEMPTTLKLLGSVKNKKILDLGCGPGFYAKILTKKGAKVKGIDISLELLKIAQKENPNLEFKKGTAEKLPYKNSEFDIVLATLIMDHLKDWNNTLSEIKRVLKKNGIFIFSIKNPVTMCLVKEKWFFKTFRQIKNYFSEDWRMAQWKGKGVSAEGAHHHKTYGTIIRYLLKNGFEILDYEDTKPLKSAEKFFPREYKKTLNAPHFCVWKVRKK